MRHNDDFFEIFGLIVENLLLKPVGYLIYAAFALLWICCSTAIECVLCVCSKTEEP